jgi:hypothetical protein
MGGLRPALTVPDVMPGLRAGYRRLVSLSMDACQVKPANATATIGKEQGLTIVVRIAISAPPGTSGLSALEWNFRK